MKLRHWLLLPFILPAKSHADFRLPGSYAFDRGILADDYNKYLYSKIQQENKDVVNLYINSAGGNVFIALSFASLLKDKYVNCYVDYAASAALQIIMPTCDKIYTHSDTKLGWHSAHIISENGFNIVDMAILKDQLEMLDISMAAIVQRRFGDIKCKASGKQFANITNNCIRQMMYTAEEWGPQEWNYSFPSGKVVIIDKAIFPKKTYFIGD